MTTPLVLPPLEEEICGAKANIYYFDWLKCLTALPRVVMTFVNPLPYLSYIGIPSNWRDIVRS